jgi:aryl-alcohol dehydrogenase-like predicted oxidoreductase
MLTGTLKSRADPAFGAHDFRLMGSPKFSEENFGRNLALVEQLGALATKRGQDSTPGKFALAWLYAQAAECGVEVIPIPGTTKVHNLTANLDAVKLELSKEEMIAINDIFKPDVTFGDRYAHMALTFHGNPKAKADGVCVCE